jgi:hypothetical protein
MNVKGIGRVKEGLNAKPQSNTLTEKKNKKQKTVDRLNDGMSANSNR